MSDTRIGTLNGKLEHTSLHHKGNTSAAFPIDPSRMTISPDSFDARVPEITVVVHSDFPSLTPFREQWDGLGAKLNSSVYLCFDWCKTWWEFYGQGKELRVFLCFAAGQLVGVVPIYVDRIGIKPLQFTVARLVGSNIPPKTFDPPVVPGHAEQIFESIFSKLIGDEFCDLISIGPVSETCGILQGFENAARKQATLCAAPAADHEGVHTVFELPASMADFFGRMEKDERKKRQYEMRLLAKEPAITRDVLTVPEQVDAEFERFARLHASQWSGKGKLGHFGSWPQGLQYNLALARAMAKLGRLRFVRILADGEVISSQYAFVFGNTWFWELPARQMDRKWNRFSLGTTGFFGLAEEAIKEGSSRIEAGIAHYDYKRKLGGQEHRLQVLRVVANRSGSRARKRIFGWLRSALLLGYYKVWYARVSPRLPAALRRPIWSFWLRLDF